MDGFAINQGDHMLSDVIVIQQYNKFQSIKDNPELQCNQPFQDKYNVFEASEALEDFCKQHQVQYMKLDIATFKAMAGL